MTRDELITLIKDEEDSRRIEFYFFEYLLSNDVNKDDLKKIYSSVGFKDKLNLRLFRVYFSINNLKNIFDNSRKMGEKVDNSSDVDERYNNIIKEFVSFSREAGCSSSLEMGMLFSLLVEKGVFFNIDKKNESDSDNDVDYFGRYSIKLFHGDGVCLNYSDMLKDIYRYAGYDAANMLNSFSAIDDYDKNFNHVVTLVMDADKPYLFDSMYSTMFNCCNSEKAINVGGRGNLILSPYLSSCFFANDKEGFKVVKDFCLKKDYSSLYNRSNLFEVYFKCRTIIDMNEELVEDFANRIKGDVGDIVSFTKVKKYK